MSSLHPHQHAALVAELRRPEYAELSADETFVRFTTPHRLDALGRYRFLTQTKFDSLPEKRRPDRVMILTDAEAVAFPTGVPGFPHKLRREWFDAAWKEARGG